MIISWILGTIGKGLIGLMEVIAGIVLMFYAMILVIRAGTMIMRTLMENMNDWLETLFDWVREKFANRKERIHEERLARKAKKEAQKDYDRIVVQNAKMKEINRQLEDDVRKQEGEQIRHRRAKKTA